MSRLELFDLEGFWNRLIRINVTIQQSYEITKRNYWRIKEWSGTPWKGVSNNHYTCQFPL